MSPRQWEALHLVIDMAGIALLVFLALILLGMVVGRYLGMSND